MGLITPTAKDIARFHSKHKIGPTGCDEWTAHRNKEGYGRFRIQGQTTGAHRIAWLIAFGPIPHGKHVLHHCDNPPCVLPSHLFLGDQIANVKDMLAKGRSPVIGTGNARLSEAEVAEIRRLANRGIPAREIAARFEISLDWCRRLIRGAARPASSPPSSRGYA